MTVEENTNKIDKNGLRQGYFVYTVNDIKFAEGHYVNGVSVNLWQMYDTQTKKKTSEMIYII